MTVTMFNKLYGHYKDTWGLEMRLWHGNVTYEEAFQRAQEKEDWF